MSEEAAKKRLYRPRKINLQVDNLMKRQKVADAYRSLFGDPENVDAKIVLHDLMNTFFISKPNAIITPLDPGSSMYKLGQRSVVDHILNKVTVNVDEQLKYLKDIRTEND